MRLRLLIFALLLAGTFIVPAHAHAQSASLSASAAPTAQTTVSTGSLTVTILPAGAAAAGAQWRIGTGPYQNSGATLTDLPPGLVVINFGPAAGWRASGDRSTTIVGGQTATLSGTYVQLALVPSVIGLTQDEAAPVLSGAGLVGGNVSMGYSATIPSGHIYDQNPVAGDYANSGSTVTLFLSMGAEPVQVPYVVGETEEAAGILIVAANLVVGTITREYSPTVPAGLVISQSPNGGALYSLGGAIYLTVSKGPIPVVTGSVIINSGASATKATAVTLGLTWSANAVRMRFSDNGSTWTSWEPLKASRPYTLPAGDGYKTVRVQFMEINNFRSVTYSDYILLDGTAPTGSIIINNGAATVATPYVFLTLTWSDGAGSGVRSVRYSNDGAHWTLWEPVVTPRTYMLPLPSGTQTVRAQFLDGAGNYSIVYSDYIKVVPVP